LVHRAFGGDALDFLGGNAPISADKMIE